MSLYKEASIILTPNAYKEGKLYSIKPGDGAGDMNVVRATTATRVNAEGLIEVVPYNLLQRSEEFDDGNWTKVSCSITANATTAPNGTTTAYLLNCTTSAVTSNLNQSILVPSGSACFSIFAKAGNHNIFRIANVSSTERAAWFDLSTGSVIGTVNGGTASIENFGNGWFRCVFIATNAASGGNTFIASVSDSANSTNGVLNGNIYLWGAQLVQGTEAKEYLRTETRLNVPRLDYTNGSCPSILVEPQRTNLVTYSEQFNDASWSKFRVTVSANSTTAPNGTLTADSLIENTDTNSHLLSTTTITITAGTITTHSIFFKKIPSSADRFLRIQLVDSTFSNGARALFDIQNGTIAIAPLAVGLGSNVSSDIENYGNGWYRASLTCKLDNTSTALRLENYLQSNGASYSASYTGDGTSGVYLWGAQLEAGSNATSYIPTVASAVTRNADVISKTGIADLIGQSEGTLFVDFVTETPSEVRRITLSDTLLNRIVIGHQANGTIQFTVLNNGSAQVNFITTQTYIKGQRLKISLGYKENDFVGYINGVQIFTDNLGAVPTTSKFAFADASDLSNFVGNINSAIIFPTRLSNTKLAQLTTL